MPYITSRAYQLPDSSKGMAAHPWFNMWERRLWPYREIVQGDLLYWYDSRPKEQQVVWLTRVTAVERFHYNNKAEAALAIRRRLGEFRRDDPYLKRAPARGYCLAYKVSAIRKLRSPKPRTFRFPHQGWLRATEAIAKGWKLEASAKNNVTLDDLVAKGSVADRLQNLNQRMADISPTRIRSIVSHTVRRDTPLLKAVKELCAYRCQFPNCGVRIPKRSGGFYVEVAHIQPIHRGGRSVLGNLLVLCPNHHKEFDYGRLHIYDQRTEYIRGKLNGREFEICLPSP